MIDLEPDVPEPAWRSHLEEQLAGTVTFKWE